MNIDFEKSNPEILVSIINMKLRDEFDSLEEMAAYYNREEYLIIERLGKEGYVYDEINKSFKKL